MVKFGRRSGKLFCVGVFLLIVIIASVFSVMGFSGGRYDRAQTGCECHASTADPSVTVDITGQPAEYSPLQVYELTITVSGGPFSTKGGFNLEASAGTLSSEDPNVQTNGPQSQATHTNPDQRSWNMNWTAPGEGTGSITLWSAGNAVNGNGNNGGDGWNLFSTVINEAPTPDVTPPEITNVLIDGLASQSVFAGTTVTLTATVSDSNTGNSNITGANYTIGQANWSSSTSMDAVALPFDGPTEDVAKSIETSGWLPGTYELYVYAWDGSKNYNVTSGAYATLVISIEQIPPEISNVMINGAAIQTYPLSSIPALVLTAIVDDSSTGNSDLEGANYTIGKQQWDSSQPMSLQDEPTSPTEVFEATLPPITRAGTYHYYVYAWDVDLNRNSTNTMEYATLVIIDDMAPTISNVLIDSSDSMTVIAGASLTLTADIDDSGTGNSNVSSANYTIGAQNWIGSVPMDAQMPPYDDPVESVVKTIDTSSWSPGTYDIYIYVQDDAAPANNHNVSSNSFATLIILAPPANVNASATTETGKLKITWNATSDGVIAGFNIYRSTISGGGYALVATVDSSSTSYIDSNLVDETTYYYVVTAFDSGGNETSDSLEVSATTLPAPMEPEPEDSEDGFAWFILIPVIVVVIVIVLILWRRKK